MNKKVVAGAIFAISSGVTYVVLKTLKKKRKEVENNVEETEGS